MCFFFLMSSSFPSLIVLHVRKNTFQVIPYCLEKYILLNLEIPLGVCFFSYRKSLYNNLKIYTITYNPYRFYSLTFSLSSSLCTHSHVPLQFLLFFSFFGFSVKKHGCRKNFLTGYSYTIKITRSRNFLLHSRLVIIIPASNSCDLQILYTQEKTKKKLNKIKFQWIMRTRGHEPRRW